MPGLAGNASAASHVAQRPEKDHLGLSDFADGAA